MEMQPGQMAYDRAITVFSPDGRLFQVEYAREAVRRGATTAGVVYSNGVVLIADRRIPNPKLAEAASLEKIHQIDENIGCARPPGWSRTRGSSSTTRDSRPK